MTTKPTEYMLTTIDNPFSPFNEFDQWLAYDISMGYNTVSFLDRVAVVSDEMSDPDVEFAIQSAIDQIVIENVSGMWRKVSREDELSLPIQS